MGLSDFVRSYIDITSLHACRAMQAWKRAPSKRSLRPPALDAAAPPPDAAAAAAEAVLPAAEAAAAAPASQHDVSMCDLLAHAPTVGRDSLELGLILNKLLSVICSA